MPNSPMTEEQQRNKKRSIDRVPTWSGTQKIPIADSAVTSTAGEEISPAFTAVSPRTIAPTMDKDMPISRGMRMDA